MTQPLTDELYQIALDLLADYADAKRGLLGETSGTPDVDCAELDREVAERRAEIDRLKAANVYSETIAAYSEAWIA